MIIKVSKTEEFEIVTGEQAHDGTRAGVYVWVGPPECESDWVLGPFATKQQAEAAALKKLREFGYRFARRK